MDGLVRKKIMALFVSKFLEIILNSGKIAIDSVLQFD